MTGRRLQNAPVASLVVVIPFIATLMGCAAIDTGRKPVKPPFKWDETYSTPGTSLKIEETSRMRVPRGSPGPLQGTVIFYQLKSTGFVPNEALSLWDRRGANYRELPVLVTSNGLVRLKVGKSRTYNFSMGGLVPGQPLDLALFSNTSNRRAHAKWVPFPIHAEGVGGCSASAEIQTKSGRVFVIVLDGFEPGEAVRFTSHHKDEKVGKTVKVSERRKMGIVIYYGASGQATVTAKGRNCTVSLSFGVGKDAIVLQ